jgi:hypothetical protein
MRRAVLAVSLLTASAATSAAEPARSLKLYISADMEGVGVIVNANGYDAY